MAIYYDLLNLKRGKNYNGKRNETVYYTRGVIFGVLCTPYVTYFVLFG